MNVPNEDSMKPYTKDYYKALENDFRLTIKEIVPLVVELIRPKSVIDVGCGTGSWLKVFKECGVSDIWGVDGSWVDKERLHIPEERFLSFDLKKPLKIDRRFDLVVSIEVAEHLPKERAEIFIDSLTRLGPVILFSAAIPFQGGVHHINEQWPDYWARYFKKRGFAVIDCIRKKIWQNDNVLWCYAQNVLMFAKRDYIESNILLKREFENTNETQLQIVHPRHYLSLIDPEQASLRRNLFALPVLIKKRLRRKFRRFFKEK